MSAELTDADSSLALRVSDHGTTVAFDEALVNSHVSRRGDRYQIGHKRHPGGRWR